MNRKTFTRKDIIFTTLMGGSTILGVLNITNSTNILDAFKQAVYCFVVICYFFIMMWFKFHNRDDERWMKKKR